MRLRLSWRAVAWAIATIVIAVVAVIVVAVMVAYSGVYNVAATYPNRGVVDWFLGTTSDNSVKHHAEGLKVPSLDNPEMVRAGFRSYRELCVGCHGAPGVEPGDLARGLNPDPPKLVESAGDWKPNELFWMTKNGFRMTGMPAWSVTHTDAQLWDIVAFVRRLPKMSEQEYATLDRTVPPLAKQ